MEKVCVSTDHKPIKMWLKGIESEALIQTKNLARMPVVFKHVALMPDAHVGYGVPIGCVFASEDVVIPNAVGVDIGCGMIACRTKLLGISKENLTQILYRIDQEIPMGFGHHKKEQSLCLEALGPVPTTMMAVIDREYHSALKQIGTLGGGNHFIEIQEGSDGHIWVMIHSGSRNVGLQVAKHYHKLAQELNSRWMSQAPKDLAFLPVNTKEGQAYINEMTWCKNFAFYNREIMMDKVMNIINEFAGNDVRSDRVINIAHNYAAHEVHFGRTVWVHRKGATRAFKDEYGIIPGSQGTASYIVRGKGNELSFRSCSHGAGRCMGRKAAKKALDLKEQQEIMKGVVHNMRTVDKLDEAPWAYKDIEVVMANQRDLVDIVTKLKPIACIKG